MNLPQKTQLHLSVNGEDMLVLAETSKTLLEVLREDLGLTGTKHGCELGECGACTVLCDGKPVMSCLVLALECEDVKIETIEGMASDGQLHPSAASIRGTWRLAVWLLHPGHADDSPVPP